MLKKMTSLSTMCAILGLILHFFTACKKDEDAVSRPSGPASVETINAKMDALFEYIKVGMKERDIRDHGYELTKDFYGNNNFYGFTTMPDDLSDYVINSCRKEEENFTVFAVAYFPPGAPPYEKWIEGSNFIVTIRKKAKPGTLPTITKAMLVSPDKKILKSK